MERGRILILGQTKENTYEIRNLLDNRRFELEIALSKDVGKSILSQRSMNLLILHTETMDENDREFFEFIKELGIEIPVFILGEDTERFRSTLASGDDRVRCFEKPYPIAEMLSEIETL